MRGYLVRALEAMPKADFKNWRLRPLWSLEEGVQLLFGIEPVKDVLRQLDYSEDRRIEPYYKIGPELRTRIDIGIRSIKAGVVPCERCGFEVPIWCTEFRPKEFLSWARQNGWEIPGELIPLLESEEAHDLAAGDGKSGPGPDKKPRQNQIAKATCQGIARTLWKAHPDMTISDMAQREEVLQFGGAQYYTEKVVRGWLSEVDPRPPGKKTGRPKRNP